MGTYKGFMHIEFLGARLSDQGLTGRKWAKSWQIWTGVVDNFYRYWWKMVSGFWALYQPPFFRLCLFTPTSKLFFVFCIFFLLFLLILLALCTLTLSFIMLFCNNRFINHVAVMWLVGSQSYSILSNYIKLRRHLNSSSRAISAFQGAEGK